MEEEAEVNLPELTKSIQETNKAIQEGNAAMLSMMMDLTYQKEETKADMEAFVKMLEEV